MFLNPSFGILNLIPPSFLWAMCFHCCLRTFVDFCVLCWLLFCVLLLEKALVKHIFVFQWICTCCSKVCVLPIGHKPNRWVLLLPSCLFARSSRKHAHLQGNVCVPWRSLGQMERGLDAAPALKCTRFLAASPKTNNQHTQIKHWKTTNTQSNQTSNFISRGFPSQASPARPGPNSQTPGREGARPRNKITGPENNDIVLVCFIVC